MTGTRRHAWKPAVPVKPWKAPRAQKLFEAKPMEPGAAVTWQELVSVPVDPANRNKHEPGYYSAWVTRTGQVWSSGVFPKSVWVIPDQPFLGERAVCVSTQYGGSLEHKTTWTEEDHAKWRDLGGDPYRRAS